MTVAPLRIQKLWCIRRSYFFFFDFFFLFFAAAAAAAPLLLLLLDDCRKQVGHSRVDGWHKPFHSTVRHTQAGMPSCCCCSMVLTVARRSAVSMLAL
jgi:hypothetical protein